MSIRTYAIVFALACLDQSTACAQEMMPIIPDGIVEHFIDPYKTGVPEFPDGAVAEIVPEVTQNPDELAASLTEGDAEDDQAMAHVLPGGIADQFSNPFGKELEDAEVAAVESQESEEMTETEEAASLQLHPFPGGIAEQFRNPYKVREKDFRVVAEGENEESIEMGEIEIAVSEEALELDETSEFDPDLPQVVPGGVVEQFTDPYKAIKPEAIEIVTEMEESWEWAANTDESEAPEKAEILPGGVVEQFADPYQIGKVEWPDQPSEIASQSIASDMPELPADVCCDPEKRWYVEIKPGYYFLTDKDMREFFGHGGFTARVEAGCKVWGPLIVWFDGGYFQKSGTAIGGTEDLEIKLATITLGLKGIYYWNDYVAMYAGAGPRLFMMMMENDSPFVRGDDNEIGIGGGFDAGFWFFPIPQWRSFFLDLFADYSWKKMKVEEDEISSADFDVDVSGLSIGLGLGIKF